MTKLQSKSYTERVAALAAAEHSHQQAGEREVKALKAQADAVNARVLHESAEARRAFHAAHAELGPALVADFQREAAPLVQAWMKQPARGTASALGSLFSKYDQRAHAELGAALWDGILATVFVAELVKTYPSSVIKFAQDGWGRGDVVEVLGAFRRSVGASAGQIEVALAALESTLESIAMSARGAVEPHHTQRLAVKLRCATHGDAGTALATFDESERVRRNAEHEASYVMPTPPGSLAPRPSQSVKDMVVGLLS